MNYEADLDDLRDDAERKALESAIEMLESETTPATARASVIRAILGDAATRRHDPGTGELDPSAMSPAQLTAAIEENRRLIARRVGTIDADFVDVTPPKAGVFD